MTCLIRVGSRKTFGISSFAETCRVIDRSMQIHGGLGVAKDLPFERWYREIRIRRIGEGPSEVQKHIIARDIIGSGLR